MSISRKSALCFAAVVIGTGLAISLRAGLFSSASRTDATVRAAYGPSKAADAEGKACCEKPPSRAALFNTAK
jgi:hypothetical protein